MTWIRPNPKRKKRLFERNFFSKARVEYGNRGPSYVSGKYGSWSDPVENAHYECRGMGGCGANYLKVIPMLQSEHGEQEGDRAYFEKRGLDPAELAARFEAKWLSYAKAHGLPHVNHGLQNGTQVEGA